MSGPIYDFAAPLWQHGGPGGWHFLTVPEDLADEIRDRTSGHPRPFGALRVVATIGSTTWSTSLFADLKAGSYQLPVKARTRREAGLLAGARVQCRLELVE